MIPSLNKRKILKFSFWLIYVSTASLNNFFNIEHPFIKCNH